MAFGRIVTRLTLPNTPTKMLPRCRQVEDLVPRADRSGGAGKVRDISSELPNRNHKQVDGRVLYDVFRRAHSVKSSYGYDAASGGGASAVRTMSPTRFLSYHAVQRCVPSIMRSRPDHEYPTPCCPHDPCA